MSDADVTSRIARLLRQTKARYEHPLEVAAYAHQVAGGLTPEEEAVVHTYLPSPCRVLDLGCGAGREAIAFTGMGYRVVAVDISRSMLRAARHFADEYRMNIAFVWMPNPLRVPVPNAAFDCALGLAQLLSHIPGQASRVALLQEVSRVLVPGGLLVAAVTDRTAAADLGAGEEELSLLEQAAGYEEGDLWVCQPSEARLDTPLFFHLHTDDEMRKELLAAGLDMVAYIPGNELTPAAAADAHRYRYVVARKL